VNLQTSIPIVDLFEAHLRVSDLDRSIRFYGDQLGLTLAHVLPERGVAFFWIGAPGKAMLGLWKGTMDPTSASAHVAFNVALNDVLAAPSVLRNAGIEALDFDGALTEEPVVLAWMPAVSVYFCDPDSNLLEFITMLPGPARPDLGILSWSEWLNFADLC
jgi:lactoylglutathione lyase